MYNNSGLVVELNHYYCRRIATNMNKTKWNAVRNDEWIIMQRRIIVSPIHVYLLYLQLLNSCNRPTRVHDCFEDLARKRNKYLFGREVIVADAQTNWFPIWKREVGLINYTATEEKKHNLSMVWIYWKFLRCLLTKRLMDNRSRC